MRVLLDHPLPGNVRELENILERASIVAGDGPIDPTLIAAPVETGAANPSRGLEIPEGGLILEEVEKELILKALEKAGGNKSRAATLLGLTRRTFYSRMERYGLTP
jgi:two-component system NtrC family response regulator